MTITGKPAALTQQFSKIQTQWQKLPKLETKNLEVVLNSFHICIKTEFTQNYFLEKEVHAWIIKHIWIYPEMFKEKIKIYFFKAHCNIFVRSTKLSLVISGSAHCCKVHNQDMLNNIVSSFEGVSCILFVFFACTEVISINQSYMAQGQAVTPKKKLPQILI